MDGLQDEAKQAGEGGAQEPQGSNDQTMQAKQIADDESSNITAKARADYKAALKERDERIAKLEGEIAETAESAEKLRAEMDELRRRGDEERVGFELQIAGARNVKAARALLPDHDNDIEKLKAAEPWLFCAGAAAPAQTGATGLPSAGAATDEGAAMRRWRGIVGLPEDKE